MFPGNILNKFPYIYIIFLEISVIKYDSNLILNLFIYYESAHEGFFNIPAKQ